MSVNSRTSIHYQDGMELSDRELTKDCTQPLSIGNIKANIFKFSMVFPCENDALKPVLI